MNVICYNLVGAGIIFLVVSHSAMTGIEHLCYKSKVQLASASCSQVFESHLWREATGKPERHADLIITECLSDTICKLLRVYGLQKPECITPARWICTLFNQVPNMNPVSLGMSVDGRMNGTAGCC